MFADNGMSCTQTKTGTGVLGGKIWIEYLVEIIFDNTAPAVLKDNSDIISRRQCVPVAVIKGDTVNTYCQGAAIRHGVKGIEYDVVESLVYLLTVHLDYLLRSAFNGPLDIGPAQEKRNRFLHKGIHRDSFLGRAAALGKCQQLPRKTGRPIGRSFR